MTRALFHILDGSQADDCTSGFMSVDRMDVVFGNGGDVVSAYGNIQGIFPEVNFTCSGTIQSWIFGALEQSNGQLLPELQIWRPDGGDGSYTKVESISTNSTRITLVEEGQTGLYQYPLSSPLHFQAGDILGYYQPARMNSQWLLRLEQEGRGRQHGHYYRRTSAASQLNVTRSGDNRFQSFVNVVTGKCIIGSPSLQILYCYYIGLMSYRLSRLCVWFHECGKDEASTGTGQC